MLKDLERIKKKLNELDSKLDKLTDRTFAYLTAILQILEDKGVASHKEIIGYLEKHKKGISKVSEGVEFWKIMKQFRKKRHRGEQG